MYGSRFHVCDLEFDSLVVGFMDQMAQQQSLGLLLIWTLRLLGTVSGITFVLYNLMDLGTSSGSSA